LGSLRETSGETCDRGDGRRSQSLRSTEAVQAARGAESKVASREGRQGGGGVKDGRSESASKEPSVPVRATQDSCTLAREGAGVDYSIWTERMLARLPNGVKGNQWFSLIDKVYRPQTLREA
jgi:hypothetical protein